MTYLQQIIAGDPASWHEFIEAVLFIVSMIGLFVLFLNKIWFGRGLLWFAGLLMYGVYLLVRIAKHTWNYIVAVWNGLIDYMIAAEEAKQKLTPEERMYLDQTNLWI